MARSKPTSANERHGAVESGRAARRVRGRAYVGTSGWSYREWKDDFYAGVPQKDWLKHCARHFTALEVNGTFYHELALSTFESWRSQTPRDFRFAIKGHRFLTHVKRLEPAPDSVERQRATASGLGDKLAAVLWQTPGGLARDLGRLSGFLQSLGRWPEVRHAIEFRNRSWFDDEVARTLAAFNVASCQSDAASWPMWNAVTTDLVYVRLHGHTATYASNYRDSELRKWAARIRRWLGEGRNVHVYFDNTAAGNAPRNALRLIELLK